MSSKHSAAVAFGAGVALGVAAAEAIHRLGPPELTDQQRQATMEPYLHDVAAVLQGYTYVLVGGMPIDVFNDPRTTVDENQREIVAPDDFSTPQYRKNRTRRDHDIFVLANPSGAVPNAEELSVITAALAEKSTARAQEQFGIEDGAIMSVFSFDSHDQAYDGLTQYTSATTQAPDGRIMLRHGNVAVELPASGLQVWTMKVGDLSVPVLDPRVQLWRSRTRFMSGTKTKDRQKLSQMEDRLAQVFGSDWAKNETCAALQQFHDAMLHASTLSALREALETAHDTQSAARAAKVAGRIALRHLGGFGNNLEWFNAIVQAHPEWFDRKVGAAGR